MFLLGSLFTPFQGKHVNAQFDIQDWIHCNRLTVYDESGFPLIDLSADVESGAVVNVFGKGGWASLSANKDGGTVVVAGESGEGRLNVDADGARFSLQDDGKSEARLSTDEHGGVITISNKDGKKVGYLNVSATGNGTLSILDKQGKETGRAP